VSLSSLDVLTQPYVDCEVRGVACRAQEARFGGTVVLERIS